MVHTYINQEAGFSSDMTFKLSLEFQNFKQNANNAPNKSLQGYHEGGIDI